MRPAVIGQIPEGCRRTLDCRKRIDRDTRLQPVGRLPPNRSLDRGRAQQMLERRILSGLGPFGTALYPLTLRSDPPSGACANGGTESETEDPGQLRTSLGCGLGHAFLREAPTMTGFFA